MTVAPVLMYHAIGAQPHRTELQRFVVSVQEFAHHLDIIRSEGFRTVAAAEIALAARDDRPLARHVVALTFDDALTDFAEFAVEELLQRDMVATIFVPTAFMGGRASWLPDSRDQPRRILAPDALRSLVACGMECGAHSHRHPQMDRLSSTVLREEARRPKEALEGLLGSPVTTFAYPFGYHSARSRRAVSDAHYVGAFAVSERPCEPHRDNPMSLPRITAVPGLSDAAFVDQLWSGRRRYLDAYAEAKRVAWRWRRELDRLAIRERPSPAGFTP